MWIYVGNNARVEAKGIGTCQLHMRDGQTITLHDVLYAPEIHRNLVSIVKLLDIGLDVFFSGFRVSLLHNQMLYGVGFRSNNFFVLDIEHGLVNINSSVFTSHVISDNNLTLWHARLGYIGQNRMYRLAREGLLGNIDKIDLPTCEHCLAGKSIRKPFGKGLRAQTPL